jgi:hypothetical protein
MTARRELAIMAPGNGTGAAEINRRTGRAGFQDNMQEETS